MTSMKALIAAGAVAGIAALPASALELGADARLGISFEDGVAVEADAGITADADAPAPEMPDTYVEIADSTFVGDTVQTNDGELLGVVTEAWGGEDSETRLRIELAEEAGIDGAEAFWFYVAADADADGTLVLPMSKAEFMAQVGS